jgi:molybdopterin-containing oxidoreductase family membrane subunit
MSMDRTSNKSLADDLVRPLFNTVGVVLRHRLATGTVVSCGAVAWGYQLWYGIGLSGKRWPTFWALYLTNFVFWIGISHAGTLISAILRLVNATWRRPVTRCAEVIRSSR